MTAPSNLRFATAGSGAGTALNWTATPTSAATGFGSYDGRRGERFVNWPAGCAAAYRFAGFVPSTDLVAGLYVCETTAPPSALPHEDFSDWFTGLAVGYALGPNQGVTRGVYDGHTYEGFTGWSTTGYFLGPNVVSANATRGLYDSGAHGYESFYGWVSSYFAGPNVVSVNTTAGLYNGGMDAFDAFASCVPGTWTTNPTGTSLTVVGTAPAVGVPLILSVATGGSLPSEVDSVSPWWVVYSVGPVIHVSATRGGSPVSFADTGAGVLSFAAHPAYAWPSGGYV